MKAVIYVTIWDSYTNGVSQHYTVTKLPDTSDPNTFAMGLGANVHESVCQDTDEDPADWILSTCTETTPGTFVAVLKSPDGQQTSTYCIRYAP